MSGQASILTAAFLAYATLAHGQSYRASDFQLSGVSLAEVSYKGEPAFEMRMPAAAYQDPAHEILTDRAFMAWLPMDFHDGVIEVEISGEPAADAPAYARGFVGVSFRIGADRSFENVYLRPTNGPTDDPVRKGRAVQYFAYPDWTFDRLRREAPGRYETQAEIAPGRWTHYRLVVKGVSAKLYLNHKDQPVMQIEDLKLGAGQRGGVGLWIESGTLARFRNLRIQQTD
ncbi:MULTISPECIES: family 16 glycoside hydrolase [Caulobacter]|uniref:family 16 glycoside hydrolase n=1 Tax=Caulobacter TaxID=75 RepID=UPI0018EE75E1|nr:MULTISPECIES: family 16 glycoside hydrolase [Caulobacter]